MFAPHSFPRKKRSRTQSLPFAAAFFLFFLVILSLNYALSARSLRRIPLPPSSPSSSSSSSSSAAATSTLFSLPNTALTVRSAAGYGNLCTSDNIFSSLLSLLFLIPIIILCFIGLAIVTDDYFVAALEQICDQLKLTEDVAGATFMAAGSSTPEFFASIIGVFVTKDEVGVGTIVGSAVFNILIIVGLSAALAGSVLHLDWRPLMRDSFFYIVSIFLLFLFTTIVSKGVINWWEGLILVATYVIYVLFMAFGNKPYMARAAKLGWFGITPDEEDVESGPLGPHQLEQPPSTSPLVHPDSAATTASDLEQPSPRRTASSQVPKMTRTEDGKWRYRDLNMRTRLTAAQRLRSAQYAVIATQRLQQIQSDILPAARSSTEESADMKPMATAEAAEAAEAEQQSEPEGAKRFLGVALPTRVVGWIFFPMTFFWKTAFRLTIVDCSQERFKKLWWVTFLLSIVWISGISYAMVTATRVCGCLLNIPATAMGLTVLAAGTSIPDALASIAVARDGAGDMAVSNAIGSNVFDILLGLGLPWFLGDLILPRGADGQRPITIPTEPITLVVVPIIILFGIMLAFIAILVALKWKMKPLLGYLLCALYVVFVVYTLLDVYVFKIG